VCVCVYVCARPCVFVGSFVTDLGCKGEEVCCGRFQVPLALMSRVQVVWVVTLKVAVDVLSERR